MPQTSPRRPVPLLARWREYLLAPVDGASLAVFRACFGLIMLWEVIRYFAYGWVADYYIEPPFQFTYPFFSWVRPWPGNGMYWHFLVLGEFALLMAVGRFYRPAAWGFFLGFTYVFLLEKAGYL